MRTTGWVWAEIRKFVSHFLGQAGNSLPFKVIKQETWLALQIYVENFHAIARWSKLTGKKYLDMKKFVLENIELSNSQLQQELVALFLANENTKTARAKYFVEIGANDGIRLSNTYLLETEYNWTGLLSEANSDLIQALKRNRKQSILDFRAVSDSSGEVKKFLKTVDSEFASLEDTSVHERRLIQGKFAEVQTVTATDLFKEYNVPSFIDFLSIDTEGNEFEILAGIDFEKYSFGFICVEVTRNASEIRKILSRNGYVQILESVSAWDQWWVNADWN